jgi:hypothetical protein
MGVFLRKSVMSSVGVILLASSLSIGLSPLSSAYAKPAESTIIQSFRCETKAIVSFTLVDDGGNTLHYNGPAQNSFDLPSIASGNGSTALTGSLVQASYTTSDGVSHQGVISAGNSVECLIDSNPGS